MTGRHLATILLLCACAEGAGSGALATRADSAGIEIVNNPQPSWRDGERWRIDPEPILQIGHRADNDPHYDLFRVTGVRELPDDQILALLAGQSELRIFDHTGTWVRSIGRAGDGPGEMRNPGSLLVSSDSIFVVDMGLGRANTFRADGNFLGSAPYPATESGRRIRPIWRMADGQWIGTTQVPTPGQSTEGHHRDSVEYHLLSADLGQVEHRIVAVPGPEMYGTTIARGEGQIQSMRMMLPLARSSMSKPTETSLLTGENSRPQLSQYSASGALETIIRWAAPIVPVDADLLGRMKSARLEEAAGNAFGEQVINSQFATPGLAEAVPYFVAIHLDATEAIWLQNYQVVSGDSLHFTVFDPTGQWLGQLSLPPRHAVHAIGTDRILTVWRDADDLEYIRVYRLRR